MLDDDWDSQRQMVPIRTEVTVLSDRNDVDAGQGVGAGASMYVDWNSVELDETNDLVIAPMANTEMAKIFGIPVDYDGGNRTFYEDVDREVMENAADDVNDAHYDELVTVYDKENLVIAVGKLF